MNQHRTGSVTRDLVLETCSQILQPEGLTNLNLGAVTERAGLDKGGLLYPFPSKESLIEALFEYHNNKFETRLQALADKEADNPWAWFRAYAKVSIEQITDVDNASL